MLTFEEYAKAWSPREDYLRRELGTTRTGWAFWDLAYKHYVRLEGYATVKLTGFQSEKATQH